MPGEESLDDLESLLQAPPPASDVQREAAPDVMNVGLLVVFAIILAAVAISNIWLRRRAARRNS